MPKPVVNSQEPVFTYIETKVELEGFHYWAGAPEDCAWLRDNHRHIFVIRVVKRVYHDDRDVEFILFGRAIRRFLEEKFADENGVLQFGGQSCEMIGRLLLQEFSLVQCSVHEDDENGAIVSHQSL